MSRTWKIIGLSLLALYFVLLAFPNAVGSVDQNMVSIFEADEFAQFPHVISMLTPKGGLMNSIRRFFAYQHYYYGFPFYLLSAIVILPLKLFISDFTTNATAMMLALRQLVSVLPMLGAISIIVYLQTRFKRTFQTFLLFGLLLIIPAVVENNLWWHPDSLTILFIALVFFFLDRDDLRFSHDFYLAALFTGLATGTKLIGLYLFLTIPAYILIGILRKRINVKTALKQAAFFVGIMFVTVLVSNPMLFTVQGRSDYLRIQQAQMSAMAFGWQVAYDKGILSWVEIIRNYYGRIWFIALTLVALALGLRSPKKRLLHVLILTWVLPYSLYILILIAIKPTHFFLPVILPLFSTWANLLNWDNQSSGKWLTAIATLVLILQGSVFLIMDQSLYTKKLLREKNNRAIQFYQTAERQSLSKLEKTRGLVVYRDTAMYIPNSAPYEVKIKWGLIDYNYVADYDFDLLFIWKQRAYDYTQEGVVENAAEPAEMALANEFYWDVRNADLNGYVLLLEDNYGYLFTSDALVQSQLSTGTP